MKTLEQQMAELEKEHEKKVEQLKREHAAVALLPDYARETYDVSPHFLGEGGLYGSDLRLSFRHNQYKSLRKHPNPTPDLIRRLAADLPALPIVLVRDGCAYFATKEWADKNAEKLSRAETTAVAPFTVRLCSFQGPRAEFVWYTRLEDSVATVKVEIPMYEIRIGNIEIVRQHRGFYTDNSLRIERQTYTPPEQVRALAEMKFLTLASGSPDVPKDHVLYYPEPIPGTAPTLIQFVDAVTPVPAEIPV